MGSLILKFAKLVPMVANEYMGWQYSLLVDNHRYPFDVSYLCFTKVYVWNGGRIRF